MSEVVSGGWRDRRLMALSVVVIMCVPAALVLGTGSAHAEGPVAAAVAVVAAMFLLKRKR